MSGIVCRLLYQSASPHIQQLYTGFQLLHRSGFVRLSQARRTRLIQYESDAPHLKDAGHAHLDVLVGGRLRLHFDMHDAREVPLREVEDCHFYFKRSYSPAIVGSLPEELRGRVHPLGLNYRVLPDSVDWSAVRRALSLNGCSARVLGACRQALDGKNLLGFEPRLRLMQQAPNFMSSSKVLFLVAAYDPYDDPARSPEKIDERFAINATRAQCIRMLKEALGGRFTGGFVHSRFAAEQYPDLMVPPEMTTQVEYIRTLLTHDICVATTGLHGSIGWKLAEYVAFSKAILTERLMYQVPGIFAPEINYVEFASPSQCVNGALRLMSDVALRRQIMWNNSEYYRDYLHPDALVRNALTVALERHGS